MLNIRKLRLLDYTEIGAGATIVAMVKGRGHRLSPVVYKVMRDHNDTLEDLLVRFVNHWRLHQACPALFTRPMYIFKMDASGITDREYPRLTNQYRNPNWSEVPFYYGYAEERAFSSSECRLCRSEVECKLSYAVDSMKSQGVSLIHLVRGQWCECNDWDICDMHDDNYRYSLKRGLKIIDTDGIEFGCSGFCDCCSPWVRSASDFPPSALRHP